MAPVANRDSEADGPNTSGMVALMPTAADAKKMAVDGGEDPDQLHLTLAYLGDNATGMPPESRQALHQVMAHTAAETSPVTARAAGHLLFNPDGGPDGDRTPCAAYLVSDSDALGPLHDAASAAASALDSSLTQHTPFIPHVTGAYNQDAGSLGYAGPVSFDRMRVAFGPDFTDYPLDGSAQEEAEETPEQEGAEDVEGSTDDKSATQGKSVIDPSELAELTQLWNEVKAAADGDASDHALPDGSYQINHPGQLKTAISALTAYQVDKSKRGALRRHVIKQAKRLNAENMLPKSITDESDDDTRDEKKATPPPPETRDAPSPPAPARYGQSSGTVLGPPRDAAAAQAQQNTGAVGAFRDLLAGNTSTVEPLNSMDPSSLEALTRVAFSYNSTDPKVMAVRSQLSAELARRGLKATDYGALGAPPSKQAPAPKQAAPGVPAPKAADASPDAAKALDVVDLEYKVKYDAEQTRAMAKKGQALPDGSYPIKDRADLDSAIKLRNHSKSYSAATVHKHIVKRAKAIGATDMLPDDLSGSENKALSWDGAPDSFTGGVLLGLSGLDTEHILELKAGPPGATFASPDPNAKRLRDYWVHGKGALKIQWGVPGDFDRCVIEMTKYVGDRAKGLCNIYHRSALGVAPGQEDKPVADAAHAAHAAKSLIDSSGQTTNNSTLWVRDPAAVDGWRAYAPAWPLPASATEVKAARPPSTQDEEDDPTTPPDDDDVLSALDNYASMVPQISPEDAYIQAISEQIPWQLAATGDLVDPQQNTDNTMDPLIQGFGPGGPEAADQVPDADDAGGDDAPRDADGELFGEDVDDDQGDDTSADGDQTAQGDESDGAGDGTDGDDGGAAIPQVAELLAALMSEEEAPLAPNDDDDSGEAEEATGESNRQRVPAATTA